MIAVTSTTASQPTRARVSQRPRSAWGECAE
jgi:hypothetical protein